MIIQQGEKRGNKQYKNGVTEDGGSLRFKDGVLGTGIIRVMDFVQCINVFRTCNGYKGCIIRNLKRELN